jgi:hypothetical protein
MLKPLCEKEYLYKILEIIATLFMIALLLIISSGIKSTLNLRQYLFVLIVLILIILGILFSLAQIIYWIFQPHILIYQYDSGIIY